MTGFLQDLRFSARTLIRSPLHTSVILATFAVGIAACTLVVGVVNAVLYRPFDAYADPGRLVFLFERDARRNIVGVASPANMRDWQRAAHSFDQMAGIGPASMTLTGHGEAETVVGVAVTESTLGMVDGRAQCGRLFSREDYAPTAVPSVLLTHALWERRFGANCAVVGRTLTLNGRPTAVVGVLSRAVTLKPLLGVEPEILKPLAVDGPGDRAARSILVVARLRRGVTVAQAGREMQAIAGRLAASEVADRGWDVYVKKVRGLDLEGDAGFIVVLGVGVVFVLLIVCANIANLLLVRAAGRTKEIATRRAIGAGRLAIVRLVLTEVLILGLAGSAAAIVLAWWACRALAWWISGTNLGVFDVQVDTRVVAFTVGVSALAALVAGGFAAFRLARTPVRAGLAETAYAGARMSAGRMRRMLVACQIALALVLLVGCGLVLKGVVNLRHNEAGFRTERLATASARLSDARYDEGQARTLFVTQVLERLAASGEVESASASDFLPMAGGEVPVARFSLDGLGSETAPLSAGLIAVGDTYFRTLGIPVKAGRTFTPDDRDGAQPVAIVNQCLVRRWMEKANPLGARLIVDGTARTVVGVVGDVRNFHLNVAPAPAIYVPFAQRPGRGVALLARMRSDGAAALPVFKAAVASIDRNQPVGGGDWMERVVERSMGGFDMTAAVVGVLAVVALGLASVGVFGVVAYSVARRTREIGIRLALGASPSRVVAHIVCREARTAVLGAVPGLLLAAAVGRLLASKLPRVAAAEPVVLGGASLIAFAAFVLAAYGPARGAARVDPAVATRVQ